jgi:hypothetical protein
MSSHGGSLAEAFELAKSLGYDLSAVTVYGIEVETTAPETPLSPRVQAAADELGRTMRESCRPPASWSESVEH